MNIFHVEISRMTLDFNGFSGSAFKIFKHLKRLTRFLQAIFRVKRKIITYTFLIYVNGSSTLAFDALLYLSKHKYGSTIEKYSTESVIVFDEH